MIIGFGSDFWGNAIFITTKNMNRIDSEFIPHIYKILPVLLSCLGVTASFLFYLFGSKLLVQVKMSVLGKKIYNFLNKK
jgi:NADH-ubiquinone oxidoreductase chain 5